MYSATVQEFLEEHDLAFGDRVRIVLADGEREGRLMPRAKQGNNDAVVLKLANGYNIGIDLSRIDDIELVERREEPEERKTAERTRESDLEVAVLHTGGTIASRVSYSEGGVKPAFEVEDLLVMYPELFEKADIESEVVAQMLSEDMEPGHWQELAEAVAEHQDADGIIIGHGTDTMQYTAAALSFMLEGIDVPVVLVGAQRSSDRPSSDAAMNLLCATEFIAEGKPGVFVCMHGGSSDEEAAIHRGTRVRKMHTSRRDAFKTIGGDPVATVDYETGEVEFNEEVSDPEGEFDLRTDLNTNVGLAKTLPGIDPEVFSFYEDYDGLIVEGTGLGHAPVNSFDDHTERHEEILEMLEELASHSVVAMTSQCLYGRVNMNVYDAGVKIQEAGVVSAENMLPGVAYVKLMWSLGQTDSREEAEELFRTDVAGEIQPRETEGGFYE